MPIYERTILKSLEKGELPKPIFIQFDNAFRSLELTKDMSLFDITRLRGNEFRNYYCMRKGKYRALFFVENEEISVIRIDKREDVYK